MNGLEHYLIAEELVHPSTGRLPSDREIQAAQVHATLALASSTERWVDTCLELQAKLKVTM